MNIIFLDIDGVLNNTQHCQWIHENVAPGMGFGQLWELDDGNINRMTVGWDPVNVEALWHIIDETDAEIVISSTWRIGRRVSFFHEVSAVFGQSLPVIGMTPIINDIGSIRGDEVNEWLKIEGLLRHRNPHFRWVCLDDDGDFHPENNLVQTDIEVGLTMEDAERAIELLKG